MIIRNKLEKVFGPFGSSMGTFLIAGGVLATFFSVAGPFIAVVGAFVSFTSTSSIIDLKKNRIKYSNDLFGIIRYGRWIGIEPGMKLGISKSHKGYGAYINANQPISIHVNDIRIFLYDNHNKQIMPVKKFTSYSSARVDLNDLSSLLKLDTM